jgi:hypothetical protein
VASEELLEVQRFLQLYGEVTVNLNLCKPNHEKIKSRRAR